ncbi:N-acetylmuramoyl-L-alanine amidase [Evansella tamaricis]|uniref:N-acetylmuramoyl-L-alanine amidase n=1 Tax=Evansella tamaricis TaxID=2069301 RepID=A0ABS6JHZ1_9BACI|nr:N-acetylmuramoyl-L-alanine amidase [Evansella tamaricis]MBU9713299.1 N-acetylmuramoyl-L-alanine amidase [Evansella tamaricis]
MFKLYLDPGHGGNDSGAVGNGLKEKDVVLEISLRIRDILMDQYDDVEVKMSRTKDATISLSDRTKDANKWNADYFLSVHANAANGSANGYEDYIYKGLSEDSDTAMYRNILHKEIMKVNNLRSRGKKKANFHVLRESSMSAILTENGFIDHEGDAKKLRDPEWLQKVAQGHVNGLERAFNLTRKNKEKNQEEESAEEYTEKEKSNQKRTGQKLEKGLYKVIAGSFKKKSNAKKRANQLQNDGYDTYVVKVNLNNEREPFHRVQIGAFKKKDNAVRLRDKVRKYGIKDAFITREDDSQPKMEPEEERINGNTVLSGEQMDKFSKSVNSSAPKLGELYVEISMKYGIRGDVAFAQALLETGNFRFGGRVDKSQNNFGGLGATKDGVSGASFNTPRDGVIAHIQHLYAYASKKPIPDGEKLINPRFDLIERGSARKWVELNGKWAVPGDDYGQKIIKIYENMQDFTE